jgi:hypothetical protein
MGRDSRFMYKLNMKIVLFGMLSLSPAKSQRPKTFALVGSGRQHLKNMMGEKESLGNES